MPTLSNPMAIAAEVSYLSLDDAGVCWWGVEDNDPVPTSVNFGQMHHRC